MKKIFFIWLISLLLSCAIMVYQRITGPTYPISGKVALGDSTIAFKLRRSHAGGSDHQINVTVGTASLSGKVRWKRYKTEDQWAEIPMQVDAGDAARRLVASLPHQPPAGKLQYLVILSDSKENVSLTGEVPVIIRFRGDVPMWWLHPHIVFMVLALLLGTRAFLEACINGGKMYRYTCWTTVCLVFGGFILGPIVQHCAFGVWWSGFPLGHDATDNKTLLSLVVWLLALWRGKKEHLRLWVIVAFVALMAIYLVPHSILGSELDYSKLPAGK
jgi:hypothetical protein